MSRSRIRNEVAQATKWSAQQECVRWWGAQRCVQGFADATEKHGSLIQAMVRGAQVHQYEHYPPHDVIDRLSGAHYFYHAHRSAQSEHGHMHLFWHADSLGRRVRRTGTGGRSRWAPSHLLAIGFDARGLPVSLFTTNLWVTDGHWFDANTTLQLLARFDPPSRGRFGSVNRFLTGFLAMYRPLVEELLHQRDRRVARLTSRRPWATVSQDQRHEVLTHRAIDWLADVEALEQRAA